MIKRVDIFFGTLSQYEVLNHFTQSIYEAFGRAGIHANFLKNISELEFIDRVLLDPPDFTLSVNPLTARGKGSLLCDIVKVPHISYLVDAPHRFMHLISSPYSIMTCVDYSAAKFIQGSGFKNVLFMPHAVDRSLAEKSDVERPYEVVMLATCIDPEVQRLKWKERFPPALCEVLEDAAEITLHDQTTPYYQAFVQALSSNPKRQALIDPRSINGIEVLDSLEYYVRGKDRIEIVKAIKDGRVDVFGSSKLGAWEKYVGDQPNVVIHPAVNYAEALQIMKKSKIIINSCPTIKHGAHERVFSGFACGALPLTSENDYLAAQFKEADSIAYYHHSQWAKINDQVNALLQDEAHRCEMVEKGRLITSAAHTWDHRVAHLLEQLAPIIGQLP